MNLNIFEFHQTLKERRKAITGLTKIYNPASSGELQSGSYSEVKRVLLEFKKNPMKEFISDYLKLIYFSNFKKDFPTRIAWGTLSQMDFKGWPTSVPISKLRDLNTEQLTKIITNLDKFEFKNSFFVKVNKIQMHPGRKPIKDLVRSLRGNYLNLILEFHVTFPKKRQNVITSLVENMKPGWLKSQKIGSYAQLVPKLTELGQNLKEKLIYDYLRLLHYSATGQDLPTRVKWDNLSKTYFKGWPTDVPICTLRDLNIEQLTRLIRNLDNIELKKSNVIPVETVKKLKRAK